MPLVVKSLPELPDCDGNASTAAHDAVVPLVVKYLPLFPAWVGSGSTGGAQLLVAVPDEMDNVGT